MKLTGWMTVLCVAISTSLLIGCDKGSGLKTEPVTGKVTYQGAPVAGAQITFMETGKPAGSGIFGGATTDENGEYKVSASGGDAEAGMPAGEYTVTIKKNVPADGSDPTKATTPEEAAKQQGSSGRPTSTKMKSVIPEKYGNPNSSGLTASVKEGENTFDFTLED